MDTIVTATVGEILTWILLIVAIITLIFVIILIARATKMTEPLEETIKKANGVLDDVKVITENAKNGTEDAKRALRRASDGFHEVASILDVNKLPIAAITALIGAGTSLASLTKRRPKKR